VPTVPARAPRNLWILSGWRDLLLYVGTPLLLVPMYLLAQSRWSAQDIYLFVGAFGATGHHLPGMIRAYGDRALFDRFKWRFIIAPVFLVATCSAFYFWDLKAIVLVLFFWGVWHGMMQTYGFCRIYDAKTGSFAVMNRRLDFATCGVWFAAAVVLSQERMGETLAGFYASGGPFIPRWALVGLQRGLLAVAIAVTILFVLNFVRMWRSNARPNPVKLALLATSIAFWWYCNNGVTNILAGIALFEVFHDVQYLSLVWVYNRNRVEKDSTIGGFMRFVFRRSGSLVGLYVGLVFAYGSFAYFNSQMQIDNVKRLLTGIVAASGLLHFYYDGFIWKVRESSTRASLGLNGGTADINARSAFAGWMLHGAKWVAGFVIPVGLLCMWQIRGAAPQDERSGRVVADVPDSPTHRFEYAVALENAGKNDDALREFRTVIAASPSNADAHYHVGQLLRDEGKYDPALTEYEQAIQLEPKNGEFQFRYAETLQRVGRTDEAAERYAEAARLSPKVPTAHFAYAQFLVSRGKFDEAIAEYRAGLRIKPNDDDNHLNLANALASAGRVDEAKAEYQAALGINPNIAVARNNLGNIYVQQGQLSQAIVEFSEAARLDPTNTAIADNLRMARERDAQFSVSGAKRP
jgi:tetratricopeptide (TPR) repeat protein